MIVDDKTYLQYWHVTVSLKEWSYSIVPTSTWQTPTKPWHNSITSRLQVGQSSVLLIVATKNLRCGLISPLASPQTRAADDFEKTLRANAKQTGQRMFHSSYTGETRPVNKFRDKHEGHLIGQDQGISSISWKQDSKNLENLAHLCPCLHQTQPQYWNKASYTSLTTDIWRSALSIKTCRSGVSKNGQFD